MYDLIIPSKIHEFAIFKQKEGKLHPNHRIHYTDDEYLYSIQGFFLNNAKKVKINNAHYDDVGVISSVVLEEDIFERHEEIRS